MSEKMVSDELRKLLELKKSELERRHRAAGDDTLGAFYEGKITMIGDILNGADFQREITQSILPVGWTAMPEFSDGVKAGARAQAQRIYDLLKDTIPQTCSYCEDEDQEKCTQLFKLMNQFKQELSQNTII